MHPILFEIPTPWGPLPIYSYGVMLGTSMILGWSVVMYFGKREAYFVDPKRNEDFLANAFIFCAGSALVGSRILYMITNPQEFESIAQFFAFRRGGLVAYGGFLGGFFAAIYWVRMRQGIGLLRFSDGAAPALALGLGLTRIGCYLYGCDFGGLLPEDAPEWLQSAGTFPHWDDDTGSPAWIYHVQEENLARDAAHSLAVHPTQLYESAAGFALFGLCMFVWSRRKFHGQVLLTLAMAYGVWRFLIEYVRDDPGRGEMFGFYTSQLISLAIVPIAAFAYFQENARYDRKPYKVVRLGDPEPAPPPEKASEADAEKGESDDAPAAEVEAKAPAKAGASDAKTSGKKKKK